MSTKDARKSKWAKALRAALDDVLLDVRYLETPEGVDFLLVHAPTCGRAAVERFGAALRASGDVPPFDLMTVEEARSDLPWFAEYRSL